MILLNGNELSETIQQEIAAEVKSLTANGARPPHLAAILIGDNVASATYVRNKIRSCERVGFQSSLITHDESINQNQLLDIIKELNNNPDIDGFIVQLPLPKHIDEQKVTLAIDPRKDVDGFHPMNYGRMAQGMDAYIPATPYGILQLLQRNNIETAGKHCVVVGRSNIVGGPMSILMGRKGNPGNCTVTLAHSRTPDLKTETLRADILIVAIGIAEFITGDMVKPGAVVIDVGMNKKIDESRKSGYRLVGDVLFDEVAPLASHITPVPGGVGPMTVTALMMNTLRSYKNEVY